MIDVDDDETDSIEDKILDKADYIGDVVTGKRKIKLPSTNFRSHTSKTLTGIQTPKYHTTLNKFKKYIDSYKNITLSRLIGLGIIGIIIISFVSIALYLFYLLLSNLLQAGIIGYVGIAVFMIAIIISMVAITISKYDRK